MQAVPEKSLVRDAYERGQKAAHFGFLRASPFCNERVLIRSKRIDITPMLDAFWLAGFDGEPYPDKPADLPKVEVKSDEVEVIPERMECNGEAATQSNREDGK